MPIVNIMKKIIEEKVAQEPTLNVLTSLYKSIYDTLKPTMKIVKNKTLRTSPIKGRKIVLLKPLL